jgi:hypothetical protein
VAGRVGDRRDLLEVDEVDRDVAAVAPSFCSLIVLPAARAGQHDVRLVVDVPRARFPSLRLRLVAVEPGVLRVSGRVLFSVPLT